MLTNFIYLKNYYLNLIIWILFWKLEKNMPSTVIAFYNL